MTAVLIEMRRACLVDGLGRAEGERCKVAPAAAHEAVVEGWARFLDPADADRAREAYIAEQRAQLRLLGRAPAGWPGDPWVRL